MAKETDKTKIKELQKDYLKLVRVITAYLDAEVNFAEASKNYDRAAKLFEKAQALLVDTLQGKDLEGKDKVDPRE